MNVLPISYSLEYGTRKYSYTGKFVEHAGAVVENKKESTVTLVLVQYLLYSTP